MSIVRRYFEAELGTLENPQWEPVDDETVRKVFAGNFVDVERALEDVAAGIVVTTPGAEYRRAEHGRAVNLFTSRFANKELRNRPDLVKVAIAVGTPRWPVGYQWVRCILLAPKGLRKLKGDQFRSAYLAKLDVLGVDRIRTELEEISGLNGDRDLVLLCYENLTRPGLSCHRTMFAGWWLWATDEKVEELEPITDVDPQTQQMGLC